MLRLTIGNQFYSPTNFIAKGVPLAHHLSARPRIVPGTFKILNKLC